MALERDLYPESAVEGGYARPQTRADCEEVPRPCPFVGCIYNLYLDVNEETGSIKYNVPGVEVQDWEEESCALDVAEKGTHTLEEVGARMNLTRERIRQIEDAVLTMLKRDKLLQKENAALAEDGYGGARVPDHLF